MAFLDENGLALLWGQIIAKINESIAGLEGGSGGGGTSTDITLPVSIENGGTGATTATTARANLGINLANLGAAAAEHVHDASDITSGTLPATRGGTGLTASPSLQVNLASTSAANVFAASPRPGVTGTLPIANGGTGNTSGLAASATKLATGRTLKVNLASTSASTAFNGTAAISDIGVSGTLATGNGGTGRTDGAAPKVLVGSTVYTMRTGTAGAAGYITFVT